MQIVEPDLTVSKTVVPEVGDAGDTVTFTITVTHPAGARRADAFDVALTDTVPAGLAYAPGSFAQVGGLPASTMDDAGPLTATWATFPPGESATFAFDAVLDDDAVLAVGPEITNTVDVRWTSLPGAAPSVSPFTDDDVQRTGDDGPGGLDDYAVSAPATLGITPVDIDKSFVEGSADHTTGTDLTVGEVATFRLELELPEGELGAVEVRDAVPSGTAYVGGSLAVDDSGLDGTLGTAGVDLDPLGGQDGQQLTVVFDGASGDGTGPGVVVTPSPDGSTDNLLVLTYELVVLDVVANVDGVSRTNAATVTIAGADSDPGEVTVDLVTPDVTLGKAFDPSEAAAGDPVTVRFTVRNDGSSDAFDLTVSDVLDTGVLTGVTVVTTPAGWAVNVVPAGDDVQVVATGARLDTGEEVVIEVAATVAADVHDHTAVPGSHTNMAMVTSHTLAEGDDQEGERRASSTVGAGTLDLVVPDLRTTKTGPTAVSPGQSYTYTIRVDNDGAREATGVTIVDLVPDADLLDFDEASDGGVFDPASGDHGTVTWDVPSIPAGGHVERTVTFAVRDPMPPGTDGTVLLNTAEASDDGTQGPDPTPGNNTDTHEVTLESVVDVAVAKVADEAVTGTGEVLSYTITVTNVGNEDVVAVELTDTLPGHSTFVSASGGGVETGGVVTWPLFDLPAGGVPASELTFTVAVEVDATVPAGLHALTNTATISAPGDTNPANDSASAATPLDAAPAFDVDKHDDTGGGLVAPGDVVTYTITVTNSGDQGATGVTVTDALPAGLTFLSASHDGAHSGGVVTWDLPGELAAGDDVTVTLQVTVADPLPTGLREVVNTAVATDDGTNSDDPVTAAGDETTRLNVTAISKAFVEGSAGHTSGSDLAVGEVGTYELTVTLPEGPDIGTVAVTDQIPAGMAYVGGSVAVDAAGFAGDLGAPSVALDPDGGASGQPLTVTFSDVEVTEDGDPATTTFRLTYDAVVLDVAGNTAGQALVNSASVTVAGRDAAGPPVTVTVVEPELTITKAFGFPDAAPGDSAGSAAANDTVSVTLTVANPSPVDAFDVTVTDLFGGAVFASATVGALPGGWSASTTPDGGGTLVTFTGAQLAAGASTDLTITAVLVPDLPVPGSHTNTAAVTWQSLPGDADHQRDHGPVTGSDTFGFVVPDLRVDKEVDGPVDVEPGDTVAYTITVHNDGGRAAAGVVLTDTLPGDTTFVSASDGGSESGGVVTWPAFDLAAGDQASFDLVVEVDDPVSADAGVLTNSATALDDGSRGDDPTPGNNTGTASVGLEGFVDLALDKTVDVATVPTDGLLTYTLTVRSLGNEGADGIVLTDTLPEHTSFVSASDGGSESGGVVTWPAFSLEGAGGAMPQTERTLTVRVDASVPAGVTGIVNSATVTHPADIDGTNDTDETATVLEAVPDLAVTKTDGQDGVTAGSALTYTITVSNVGDQGATGVTVVDTLPGPASFVAASHDGDHVEGVVTWVLPGELAPGGSVELTLDVVVDDPLPDGTTSLTNVVTVTDDGSNGPDPDPGNNEDRDVNLTGADLSVVKETVGAVVPGTRATYQITVANAGPEAVSELTVVDVLPPGLSDALFEPSSGTYDPVTGHWGGVALGPGEHLTLTLTAEVALTATGQVTNTVTVNPLGHADPNPADNQDEATDDVTPVVDLVLAKELLEHTGPGGTATYVLTVSNNGRRTPPG